MAIIGIDLGTTNSLAVCWRNGAPELIKDRTGAISTPSAVSLGDNGEILVGAAAAERRISHPYATAAEFKRSMGLNVRLPLRLEGAPPADFSPEELSAMVLKRLRENAEQYLGEPVTEAVISVPAYFDDNCRRAVKTAAQIAGIPSERLVNEPSAAALAYQYRHGFKDGIFLVVDLGGGTLDISVVDAFEGVVEILAVSGDNQLGGKDISAAVADFFCYENKLDVNMLSPGIGAMIYRQAERCKIALTDSDSAEMRVNINDTVYSSVLDNDKLEQISKGLLERMGAAVKRALRDSKCTPADIDGIIAVGGSCKMPVVRKYIEKLMGKPLCGDIDPDSAIAEGAGIFAGIKSRTSELKDVILTDICPFSLGAAVMNRELGRETMDFIIERNSPLPTSCVKKYYGGTEGQSFVKIKIFQGESMWPEKNLFLGELDIQCPPSPMDRPICSVTMAYDINGILTVDVLTHADGRVYNKVFLSRGNNMTEKEIDACIQRLNAVKLSPSENEENALLTAKAERLACELLSRDREEVQEALGSFTAALDRRNSLEIRRSREQLISTIGKYDI